MNSTTLPTPPPRPYRTIRGEAAKYQVTYYASKKARDKGAKRDAAKDGDVVTCEFWSADNPRDELNQGWACDRSEYPYWRREPMNPSDVLPQIHQQLDLQRTAYYKATQVADYDQRWRLWRVADDAKLRITQLLARIFPPHGTEPWCNHDQPTAHEPQNAQLCECGAILVGDEVYLPTGLLAQGERNPQIGRP
ncbi:hypothetical protein ACFS2C_23240 [Prauserella oleivorans]|uniref:Transposase n=1 Tax=Prauserella oleivorans TaxID=1478153 RepID=A0ABW5WFQ1_9PSEU